MPHPTDGKRFFSPARPVRRNTHYRFCNQKLPSLGPDCTTVFSEAVLCGDCMGKRAVGGPHGRIMTGCWQLCCGDVMRERRCVPLSAIRSCLAGSECFAGQEYVSPGETAGRSATSRAGAKKAPGRGPGASCVRIGGQGWILLLTCPSPDILLPEAYRACRRRPSLRACPRSCTGW